MIRQTVLFVVFLFSSQFLLAKDTPETYTIRSNLTDAQKVIYVHWIKSVLDAFYAVGPGKKLDFLPTISIFDKKNSWPNNYVFYDENFLGSQYVKFTGERIEFTPIKEVLDLSNNEFAFKQVVANFLVSKNISKNIPFWFEKGFSTYLAVKAGGTSWVDRNYEYLIFLNSEKKEFKSIDQIIKFKYKLDNKESYVQEAYSYALIDWLMKQKEYLETPNLVLALSNADNKQSFKELKSLNENWLKYLETNYHNLLPKVITIDVDCKSVLDEDDLKAIFFNIKKKAVIISDDDIAVMIGYKIQPNTYKNIVALTKSLMPVIREIAVKTLGLIPDRSVLPDLIQMAINEPSEPIRVECAKAISKLNKQIAPKALLNGLSEEDPNLIGQAAISIANIGDPTVAKILIQKLSIIRPDSNTMTITTTRSYVKDYDVIDGLLVPGVGTCEDGVTRIETFPWVIELKAKIILSLNKLPLNFQGQTPELWYKWYAAQ